jgi:hypothetical protein
MGTEPKPVGEMTDRQIAEETLTLLRLFASALNSVASNPMAAMMMPPGVRDNLTR